MKPFEVHLAGNRGVFAFERENARNYWTAIRERAGARPFGGNTDNATMLITRERTVQRGINPVNKLRSM